MHVCVCVCFEHEDLERSQRIDLGVVELDGLEGPVMTVLNNSHSCA